VSDSGRRRIPLATSREVAAYLQKPMGTLAYWRHCGIGPRYRKIGKHVRYDWADVDEWLSQQPSGPRSRSARRSPEWLTHPEALR
jgi:predicted DNA-binding transcriptional regulator AlpA